MAMRPFHKVYDGISGEPGFPILEPGLFFCLYNQEHQELFILRSRPERIEEKELK